MEEAAMGSDGRTGGQGAGQTGSDSAAAMEGKPAAGMGVGAALGQACGKLGEKLADMSWLSFILVGALAVMASGAVASLAPGAFVVCAIAKAIGLGKPRKAA